MKSKIRMEIDYSGKSSLKIYLPKDDSSQIDEDPRDQMLFALMRKLTNQDKRNEVNLDKTQGLVECRRPAPETEEEKLALKRVIAEEKERRFKRENFETFYAQRLPVQFGELGYTNCLIKKLHSVDGYDQYEIFPVEYQNDTYLKDYQTTGLSQEEFLNKSSSLPIGSY